MTNKSIFFSGSLFFSVAVYNCSHAVADNESYLNMELEQLLDVPVTGSTLRDESIRTVPAAVSVFTHEQIKVLGIDYLYELLNLVPGYQFNRGADSGVNYTFSSRGRRNGSQAREVLVVIDGVSMTNPRTGSADVTLPLIPLDQIERVEIIRGPGSAIYGSSAFSGVINIITRKNQNSVKVDLGSDNRRNLNVFLAKPLGGWATDFYAHVYEDAGQSYQIQDTFTKLPISTNDPRKMFDVSFSMSTLDTKINFAYHYVTTDNFYTIENTLNDFVSSSASLKQLDVAQNVYLWDGVATQVTLAYIAVNQHLNVPVLGAGALVNNSQPSSNAPLLTKGVLAGDGYNFRITNNFTLSEKANALFGFDMKQEAETDAYIRNNYDLGQLVQGQRPVNYYGDFTHTTQLGLEKSYRSTGVYGQYQYNFSEKTDVTAGLRYDTYNHLGGRFSPRLGVVHQLTSAQTLKLLYGEAYRAPSLAEIGIINNPLLVGNPNLDYESVRAWDLIWLGAWGNTIMSVAGFRNNYKNAIVAGFTGTTRTFVNSGYEFSDGFTLGAKYFITPEWSLRTTYTDFKTLPKSAFREAKRVGSVEVNFNRAKWNWNLLTYHQGARYNPGAEGSVQRLDGFWVFNSKLRYELNEEYRLSLQVKNLSDLDFATPAQGINIPQGVPNRGREISAALEWIF